MLDGNLPGPIFTESKIEIESLIPLKGELSNYKVKSMAIELKPALVSTFQEILKHMKDKFLLSTIELSSLKED